MNLEHTKIVEDCAQGSLAGTLTFPEVVGRLAAIGVERYHADYSREEITYYWVNGDSHVVKLPNPLETIPQEFSAAGVAAAVRQSQQGEHTYVDFLRKTMAAGCVGYFVQITGRQAIYFGRLGDSHVEKFPPAPID